MTIFNFKFLIFKNNLRAFSLLEVLLYVSLLSIVLTGIVTFSQDIFETSNKANTINNIDYESNYALNFISSQIQNATSITSPLLSQTSNSLSLNDASNTPVTINLNSGQITVSFNNGNPINLTSNKIKISNLSLLNLGLPNTKGLIKISFTSNNNTPSERQEYNFTNNYETYATPKN